MHALALLAAVVVGTWNGNWFPSGRAEHRAHPDVEAATISAAAKMLASGLRAVDPCGTNDVVLCLNEMRGPRAASNLVAQIGRPALRLAVISGYRRRDRFDQQQDAIATTLPVAEAHWSRWRGKGSVTPPRGYAFAAVVVDPSTTANVYAVHLKSNYGATTREIAAANRAKRTAGIEQLLSGEVQRRGAAARPVVVAGDMNADKWSAGFSDEALFGLLESAGFANPLGDLPPGLRGTHPSKRWGDSALDYVFLRGLRSLRPPHIEPNDGLSDHFAVFALVSP
jgi:endonuclease/exonuclease/phosphatase family metal-dependent hydrolase